MATLASFCWPRMLGCTSIVDALKYCGCSDLLWHALACFVGELLTHQEKHQLTGQWAAGFRLHETDAEKINR